MKTIDEPSDFNSDECLIFLGLNDVPCSYKYNVPSFAVLFSNIDKMMKFNNVKLSSENEKIQWNSISLQ